MRRYLKSIKTVTTRAGIVFAILTIPIQLKPKWAGSPLIRRQDPAGSEQATKPDTTDG
jgi:hypothetical protein